MSEQDNATQLYAPNGSHSNLTPEQYALTRTKEFKAWFGDWENDPDNASKALDANGEPLILAHGSPNQFTVFDTDRFSIESAVGAGIYTSTSEDDVSTNYAGGGADLDNKIGHLTDLLESGSYNGRYGDIDEDDLEAAIDDDEYARELAIRTLSQGEEETYELFINIKKPFELDPDSTDFISAEYDSEHYNDMARDDIDRDDYDDEDEYEDALSDRASELPYEDDEPVYEDPRMGALLEAIESVANEGKYHDFDAYLLIEDIKQLEGFNNQQFYDQVIDSLVYATDENDNLASHQIFADIIYEAGFDGVIMDANHFNRRWNLEGIDKGDKHFIVPDPNQAKSATDNVGTFSRDNDDIRYSIKDNTQNNPFADFDKAEVEAQLKEITDRYLGKDSYMLAPNGEPTDLTEEQWLQVRTPAFKEWFGDWENEPENASKAVNEKGEPFPHYHGTGASFDAFNDDRMIWASSDSILANGYANIRNYSNPSATTVNVIPLFLNARQVFDANKLDNAVTLSTYMTEMFRQSDLEASSYTREDRTRLIAEVRMQSVMHGSGVNYPHAPHQFWFAGEAILGQSGKALLDEVTRNLGFDSIALVEDDTPTLGVFDANQVKSATNNVGTFSPATNDMRFSIKANIDGAPKFDVESDKVQNEMTAIREQFEGDENYLKAPDGTDSKLTERLWLLTRTDSFKEWYGDWQASAANELNLDANGEPRVTYSGTPFVDYTRAEIEAQLIEVQQKYEKKEGYLLAPNGKKSNLSEAQWVQVRTDAFKQTFGDWENDPASATKILDANGEPRVVYHGTNDTFDTFDISRVGQNTENVGFYGAGIYMTTSATDAYQYGKNVGHYFLDAKKVLDVNNFEQSELADNLYLNKLAPELDLPANYSLSSYLAEQKEIAGMFSISTSDGRLRGTTDIDVYVGDTYVDSTRNVSELELEAYRANDFNEVREQLASKAITQKYNPNGSYANLSTHYLLRDFGAAEVSQAVKDLGYDGIIGSGTNATDKGDEIVIFNANQIKSATNNIGKLSPTSDDIRYSMADTALDSPTLDLNSEMVQRQLREVKAQFEASDEFMKAPNGKDSNLTEPLWLLTRTQAFKNWYGEWDAGADDVNLDNNGEPKVMYHGTPFGGFDKFKENSPAYFTDDINLAERYKNPSASSIRSYRGGETYGEVKATFIRSDKVFDTREEEAAEIFETQFYRQWGNGAPLSERGVPDWTDADDLFEFIEEEGLDYNTLVVDEGGIPSENDAGVQLDGLAYVITGGNQALVLDGQFLPNELKDERYSNEIERQMRDVLAKTENNYGFMETPRGRDTKLTQQEWLLVRTPAFKEWYGNWDNSGVATRGFGVAEPTVLYVGSNDENDTLETILYSGDPAVASTDKSSVLAENTQIHSVILNSSEVFSFTDENIEKLRSNGVTGIPEKVITGFDTSEMVRTVGLMDETAGSYLRYVKRFGLEQGHEEWLARNADDYTDKYQAADSPYNLQNLAQAVFGEYSEESVQALEAINLPRAIHDVYSKYMVDVNFESIATNDEQRDTVIEVVKELGFDAIESNDNLLLINPDVVRGIDNPTQSFKDYGQRFVEDANYRQEQANSTKILAAQLNEMKAVLQAGDDYMLAPNGKPTNLSEQQWLQTRTSEFKAWYGDWQNTDDKSKFLLDANGEPAVLFHGTPDARFVEEQGSFADKGANTQNWFAKDMSVAKTYSTAKQAFDYQNSEPAVLQNFVKFDNPLVVDGNRRPWREAQYDAQSNHILDVARENGHDGVILSNVYDEYNTSAENLGKMTTTYVSFNNFNVKSAELNNGAFSPATPDIRYSMSEHTDLDARYLELASKYVDGDLTVEDSLRELVEAQAKLEGYSDDYSYRISHQAPTDDDYHKPLHNPVEMYGDDIYSPQAVQYYGVGNDPQSRALDIEAVSIIQSLRDNPDGMVTMYRAVPTDAPDTVFNGDWVSITRGYAQTHGESHIQGDFKILEMDVPAKHLYTDANSLQEWGFDNGLPMLRSELRGDQRSGELVVHDDNGDIVPLSRRFSSTAADVQYSFVGRKAETVSEQIFQEVLTRISQGDDVEQVRQDTGWSVGADGYLRLEIDDREAVMTIPESRSPLQRDFKLSDAFTHEALFKAYPQLQDYTLTFESHDDKRVGSAAFAPRRKNIILYAHSPSALFDKSNEEAYKVAIIHEVQHAIQHIEGFAIGANISQFGEETHKEFYEKTTKLDELREQRQQLIDADPIYQQILKDTNDFKDLLRVKYNLPANEHIDFDVISKVEADTLTELHTQAFFDTPDTADAVDDIDASLSYYQSTEHTVSPEMQYRNSAGENEAFNTQDRLHMTTIERKMTAPELTERVPRNEQLIEFEAHRNGKKMSLQGDISSYDTAKTQELREVLSKYLGEKTLAKLEMQGKLNLVPDYHVKGAEGFYTQGSVTLVAENLNKSTIIPTLLHEMGGHAGFQKMLAPKQYGRLMGQFKKLVASKDSDALKAKRLAERDVTNQDDEYLPYYLTVTADKKSTKLVDRTVSAVKAWAFDKLGAPIKMNANDIVALSERMIKKFADAPVNDMKVDKSKVLFSMADNKPHQKPYKPMFIDPKNNIFKVDESLREKFGAGIDALYDGAEDKVKTKSTPTLLALDGFGGYKIDDLPLELDKHVLDKIIGMAHKQDKSHELSRHSVKSILDEIADPVAIVRSEASGGLLFLTEIQSGGMPVLAAVHPSRHTTEGQSNFICSAYGRHNPENWLIKQAKKGNLLYLNRHKNALDVDMRNMRGVVAGLKNKPLVPNTLVDRYHKIGMSKVESLNDKAKKDNIIHAVFNEVRKEHNITLDDAVIDRVFDSVTLTNGIRLEMRGDNLFINHKQVEYEPAPSEPLPSNKADARYMTERENSINNRISNQIALRDAIRVDPESAAVKEHEKQLRRDIPNDRRLGDLFRFEGLSDEEKLGKLSRAIEHSEAIYTKAETKKLKEDGAIFFAQHQDSVCKLAGKLISNNEASIADAMQVAQEKLPHPNSENNFIKSSFSSYDEFKHFLSDVTPVFDKYREFKPMTAHLDGMKTTFEKLSKTLFISNRNIDNIQKQYAPNAYDGIPMSKDRLFVKTHAMTKAGLFEQHGGIITDGYNYEPKDGEFLVVNKKSKGTLLASELTEFHVTAGLQNSVSIAKTLDSSDKLENTVVLDAFTHDNIKDVVMQIGQHNETAKITVYSDDIELTKALEASYPHKGLVVAQSQGIAWGDAMMRLTDRKGIEVACEMLNKNITNETAKSLTRQELLSSDAPVSRVIDTPQVDEQNIVEVELRQQNTNAFKPR